MANFNPLAPATIEFPSEPVYRVARSGSTLLGSKINEGDSIFQQGNRFDLVEGRVIYCATELKGSFAEVLSPFRKAPSERIQIEQELDSGFMNHGGIPADWRDRRLIFRVDCKVPLPFLDLENPATLSFLDNEMASMFFELGVKAPLDISLIRGDNRRLTRAISTWTANQTDEDGEFLYSGIRYKSRLGDWECWAIFEGTDVEITGTQRIERSNPDLLAIADLYQLTIH